MPNKIETTEQSQSVSPVVLPLDRTMQMPVTTIKMRLTHRKKQPALLIAEQPLELADTTAKLSDSLNHYLFW